MFKQQRLGDTNHKFFILKTNRLDGMLNLNSLHTFQLILFFLTFQFTGCFTHISKLDQCSNLGADLREKSPSIK